MSQYKIANEKTDETLDCTLNRACDIADAKHAATGLSHHVSYWEPARKAWCLLYASTPSKAVVQ